MPQKKTVPRVCEECGKHFLVTKITARKGQGRFCGRSCASKEKARKYLPIGKTGKENPAWRGGLTKSTRGYWYVHKPAHPLSMKSGYVKRAILVMEEKLGRSLGKGEIIHHINGDKEDDSPENLEVYDSVSEHSSMHMEPRKKPKKPKRKKALKDSKGRPIRHCGSRYSWPPDEELLRMREEMTLRAIASVIGCNHKVVDRRLQRIRKFLNGGGN